MTEALGARTLLDYFRFATRSGKANLLLHKVEGTWREVSAGAFDETTKALALGLALLGVDRHDRVAILSENRPEWAAADFATLALGGLTVPIYTTYLAPQVEVILRDSMAKVVIASNAVELQKVLDVRQRCRDVEQIIVMEPAPWSAGKATPFAEVVKRGLGLLAVDPQTFDERVDALEGSDWATMIYTSGTTGEPKGAVLSHQNIVSNVETCSTLFDVTAGDVALSFLPLAHVFERMVDYLFFSRAATIAYAESIDRLAENFQEVRPHCFAAVPRVYEKMLARVQSAVERAPLARRKIFAWGVRTGRDRLACEERGETPGAFLRARAWIADRLVFSKIRARLGGCFRFAISGGAPLAPEVAEFFWSAGVKVYEGYGLTETSPVLTCNRPGEWRLGTVGRAIPGVTLRIAPDGEVLARGPCVMSGGYWRKPEETESVFEDGWLKTGDVGRFDVEGYLTLTDRKKEILVTAYGKNVAPAPIEAALRSVRYVSSAVLIGNRRKFLSVLIVPNFDRLEAWAHENGLSWESRAQLLEHAKVRSLFRQTIDIVNGDEPHERQIRAFSLLTEDFRQDRGELTPTLKVKRRVVDENYKDVIDRMYAEAEERADIPEMA
ncbi:MAG: AMP-dependent synthetase/ligase [Acidithiobacillales bacterium]